MIRIKYIESEGCRDFVVFDGNWKEQCRFRVGSDYEATGYVEAWSGCWPGEFQTHFEAPPLDETRMSHWRVRLTATGVATCIAAVASQREAVLA
jgi:hypothetical protein